MVAWEWLWTVSWLAALFTVPSVLLQREGRPVAALSWLFALFALPMLTLVAWWLVGRTHLRRKRRRRRVASAEIGHKLADAQGDSGDPNAAAHRALGVQRLPSALRHAVFPPSAGNRVTLLDSSDVAYRAWATRIEAARHHVHALYYAWHDDDVGTHFRDLLAVRAQDGIEVRLIVDGIGSIRTPDRFFAPLREAGAKVEFFLPPRLLTFSPRLNFRNHRKLLVVDGEVGFTGGVNIGELFADWDDVALQLDGPAVDQLQEVFVDDWYFCTGQELVDNPYFPVHPGHGPDGAVVSTVASGPDQRWNAVREMLFLAISKSQHRVWLMTPYLIPDDALLIALRTAVYRGVDVRLLVPAKSDSWLVPRASRTFYPALLDAGATLSELPAFSHAKIALFDDTRALVGSANLDVRSFRLNFEVSSLVASEAFNRDVARFLESRFAAATPVSRRALRKRPLTGRVIDAAAHLMSPLL